MEIGDGFLIFLYKHDKGPDGMDEHEYNCDYSGNSVNIKRHPSDHFEHHPSSPGITDESKHEENQMPWFELT